MIASLSGQIKAIREDSLIIDVGGVGFRVYVTSSLLSEVGHVGSPIALETYMHVREAGISLYGFRSAQAQDLFVMLLGVSGVGPRTALAVLSTFSPETLRSAIVQGEIAALTRIPGIGSKTAQRLILDLKDKVGVPAEAGVSFGIPEADADVINALTALGYSLSEARSALDAVPENAVELDERILAALRSLGGG